jgi:hypothetical protein
MAPTALSLPTEIWIEVLKHLFATPQITGKSIVEKDLLGTTLFSMLGTSKSLFFIAVEVFYSSNIVLLQRTHLPQLEPSYRLPPRFVREWIRRLEIVVNLPSPCGRCHVCLRGDIYGCTGIKRFLCHASDWSLLTDIADGVHEFPRLTKLVVHFVAARELSQDDLDQLGSDLQEFGGFSLRARQGRFVACCCWSTSGLKLQGGSTGGVGKCYELTTRMRLPAAWDVWTTYTTYTHRERTACKPSEMHN